MAEDNVASLFIQSPEEFDNILEMLKQSIDEQDSSPIDSPDTLNTSVSPSSESSVSTDEEEVEEHYTNSEQTCKEPQMEMSQYQLMANFGPRRKPEMTFILSISDAVSTFAFNEKCSIEINGDEIQTCYDYYQSKPRNTNKTGYCVHARLYLRDEKGCIYLMRTENPSPLSFVYSKDRLSAFKDGQLKLRLRENLTMKHLPVADDKNPPQLLIQFTLSFQNEKLLETEQMPISFTPSKKKRYAETTDIIFSPSKIPSSSNLTALEPSTKRVKSEPIPQTIVPQNQFPTASAIWSSTSPVDIINYLEAQMLSTQHQPPSHQYNTLIPTVYMLVPAKTSSNSSSNPIIMTPFPSAPMQTMMYTSAPPPKSPLKSPRKFREVQPTEFYSNIHLSISQPIGELMPTMTPRKMVFCITRLWYGRG